MTPAARPVRRRPGAREPRPGSNEAGRTTGIARSAPGGPHAAGRVDEIAALLGAHVDRLDRALPALQAAAPDPGPVGRGPRPAAARRGPAARRGQRGQRRGGAAPDRGAGGPVRRRPAPALGDRAARRHVQPQRHRQRLRLRPGLRAPGPRPRPPGRHPADVLHQRAQREPGGGGHRRDVPGPDELGRHRSRPEPAGRRLHGGGVPARRHRDRAGDAPCRPAHAVPGGGAGGGRRPAGPQDAVVDRPRVVS